MDLDAEIMIIDVGAKLEFLDLSGPLVLLHGMDFLALLVLELSIIHQLADGRFGIGRDLDKVEARFLCLLDRHDCGNNAELFSIGSNQPDFLCLDLMVDARFGINQEPPS